jgi:hypothetical protein
MRCDVGNQLWWSQCVNSSISVVSCIIVMGYGHGYGKSNNCPTLKHIALCYYLWRWLLASKFINSS